MVSHEFSPVMAKSLQTFRVWHKKLIVAVLVGLAVGCIFGGWPACPPWDIQIRGPTFVQKNRSEHAWANYQLQRHQAPVWSSRNKEDEGPSAADIGRPEHARILEVVDEPAAATPSRANQNIETWERLHKLHTESKCQLDWGKVRSVLRPRGDF